MCVNALKFGHSRLQTTEEMNGLSTPVQTQLLDIKNKQKKDHTKSAVNSALS